MANIIRDASGKSWEEAELASRISRGDPYIPTALVVQVLEDMRTMRREVYVDKALDLTNLAKRQEIDDLDFFIDCKRKAAFGK
jgi:hypothetical protein